MIVATPDRAGGRDGQSRTGAELTELLNPDLAGLMSALERRYQRHVERPHGLPAGTRQARVRRGERSEYRDVLYEEFATCVELDGQLAHPTETRWRDIRLRRTGGPATLGR